MSAGPVLFITLPLWVLAVILSGSGLGSFPTSRELLILWLPLICWCGPMTVRELLASRGDKAWRWLAWAPVPGIGSQLLLVLGEVPFALLVILWTSVAGVTLWRWSRASGFLALLKDILTKDWVLVLPNSSIDADVLSAGFRRPSVRRSSLR
jgi:hypothetical protein